MAAAEASKRHTLGLETANHFVPYDKTYQASH